MKPGGQGGNRSGEAHAYMAGAARVRLHLNVVRRDYGLVLLDFFGKPKEIQKSDFQMQFPNFQSDF